MSSELPGLTAGAVEKWLVANVSGVAAPFAFELIAGGRSNLTYRLTDADGQQLVLRRPPVSEVLATAHDMSREYRVISALQNTGVPVPVTLGYCDDPSITGASFYVMDFVAGSIIRDPTDAEGLASSVRAACGPSMARVLATLHDVDIEAVGLTSLGKPDGYVERQLRRWSAQLQHTKTRELPVVDDVHRRLSAAVPPQDRTAIVHGDYRLDNVVIGETGEVAAVLDWELCTLGDPMADLGLLMVYWAEPDDVVSALGRAPTSIEGFSSRSELLDLYEQTTGRLADGLDYFVALGYWKLACILEGVLSRYRAGAMGDEAKTEGEDFAEHVLRLGDLAADAATRAGL